MKVQVFVRLKPGVLDVQGKAVERGLGTLGFDDVSNVRVGRLIELEIGTSDPKTAETKVKELCDKLLANTVIESYEVKALQG